MKEAAREIGQQGEKSATTKVERATTFSNVRAGSSGQNSGIVGTFITILHK